MFIKRWFFAVFFMAFDVLAIPAAWVLVYCFKYTGDALCEHLLAEDSLLALSILIAVQICCYRYFSVHRGLWRFSSINDVIRILRATITAAVLVVPILYFVSVLSAVPRRVLPLYCVMLASLLCGGRFIWRYCADNRGHVLGEAAGQKRQRVLIVGSGQAAEGLVRDLKRSNTYVPVGLVDDNHAKMGLEVHGVRVLGTIPQLPTVAAQCRADLLFIAIPSVGSVDMRRIVNYCELSQLPFHTLPSLLALTSGRVTVNELRQVHIDDLLGRDQVDLNWDKIAAVVAGRVVLITGAGGSIGSELCRQMMALGPDKIVLVDSSEFNLYTIDHDLRQRYPAANIETALLNVVDEMAVHDLFSRVEPAIVLHAAAYKHVPLLEHQIRVAVRNNVLGTQIVAEASVAAKVEKFVLISSDKAVNPSNVMGMTKRVAELYCQNLNTRVETQFITVRFGNVLGSVGSVLPLFQKQLEAGGPLTVTHPQMQRYFMTIAEASQLILQAMADGLGGEIFVLDMGEPIKITYLAEQIIRLAGKTPGKDIQIKYTGLRPGEKLFEELFHPAEHLVATGHDKLFKARFREIDWNELLKTLYLINVACSTMQCSELLILLKSLVPEFQTEAVHALD